MAIDTICRSAVALRRSAISALYAQAVNEAQHARAWFASLERECERLRCVIRAYEHPQAQPAANVPAYHSV